MPTRARVGSFTDEPDVIGDYYDMQFRIGYHPGVRSTCRRRHRRRAPAPTHAPPPQHRCTPDRQGRAAIRARWKSARTSTVTATVQDSISCAVTVSLDRAERHARAARPSAQTLWTAPQQEGSVPVTVTVTCPTDNKTASDTVNIQVTRPRRSSSCTFEDVYFDFDRYSLRPEATRLLDEAVRATAGEPDAAS